MEVPEEEEPAMSPSHGARSCSSLIRLEQELKRKGREEQQRQRQRLMSGPIKDSQNRRGTLGLPWEQASSSSLPRLSVSTASSGKRDSDDILEFVDFTRRQPWWRRLFASPSPSTSHTEKYNVLTQLTIGGGIGWCTGFIFQKVGKLAATAVGGGFFLLQVASHTGYVKVDWQLLEQDVSKAKEQLKFHSGSSSNLPPDVKNRVDEMIAFLKKNVVMAGGFVGGFLLGMAS